MTPTNPIPSTPLASQGGEVLALAEHELVPLVEPVTIHKAMLAHRPAEVWLNEGTGPVCCVALVNIQVEPWNRHTPTEAKAFADGFNLAAKWMRNALAQAPGQDALLAVAQREAWQPIETAPRDGRSLLLLCDGALRPAPGLAHWSETDGRGWLAGNASDWIALGFDAANEQFGHYPNPTRWWPLPGIHANSSSASEGGGNV